MRVHPDGEAMTNTFSTKRLTRRDLLRFVGASAGASMLLGTRAVDALAQQSSSAARAPAFPAGSVVRTVLTDIPPATITGPTLFHEHMSLSTAYWDQMLASFPSGVRDRLAVPKGETYFLENLDLIVQELRAARQDGISCIVDGGHADMGRSVRFLREASTRSGMPIVVSGGYYTQPFHPADLATMSDDQLAERLVREAAAERWGAYGEIASSTEMTDGERKVLRAVGKAHLKNGLPIFTHNTGLKHAVEQLDILAGLGVKPDRIVIGHLGDVFDAKAELHQSICRRGASVGFDRGIGEPQAKMIKLLVDAGFADRVLMSSDFAIVGETKAKGGPGYAKTVTLGRPALRAAGVDARVMEAMLVDNPRRFLAFVPR
jgi:phosphotriesterase-related protein